MIFLFVFKKMPNNVVTSHSLIVRTALVNDPSEIFVCLQKGAKQCCDVTKLNCVYCSEQWVKTRLMGAIELSDVTVSFGVFIETNIKI